MLNPANASDGYGDWDEDGMNNLKVPSRTTFRRGQLYFPGWRTLTKMKCQIRWRPQRAAPTFGFQSRQDPTWTDTTLTARP